MTDLSPFTRSTTAELLPPRLSAKYPYARGYFLSHPPEDTEIICCQDLLVPETLTILLERFEANFPSCDRRAIVSSWSMHYFNAFTIGAAIATLEAEQILPLKLGDVRLCLEQKTARPYAFVVSRSDEARSGSIALAEILKLHAEPLIEALAVTGKLSRKLLWSNVFGYLGWIVDEIIASGIQETASEWARLIRAGTWPDGWQNPMHNLMRSDISDDGLICTRRRICCLGYKLPLTGGCGAICPIPIGRHHVRDTRELSS